MFLTTASPLAAAIGCVASRPSLYRVLLCRPVTPLGLGCQRNRIAFSSASKTAEALDREKADSLVLRFTEEERIILLAALQSYQAKKDKAEYEGQLAAIRWRSRFGRPSKVPNVGSVDPTGSFCPVPEDWLMRKYVEENPETVPQPTSKQLLYVALHNAVPFVGFGFLDNAIMIIAGDYIELGLGSCITISTMAAAALGNTFSDIMGIGSAYYVEALAAKVGMKPPNLSPIQLNMDRSRWVANLGRCLGVTIGCLLGMLPLLFMNNGKGNDKENNNESQKKERSD